MTSQEIVAELQRISGNRHQRAVCAEAAALISSQCATLNSLIAEIAHLKMRLEEREGA